MAWRKSSATDEEILASYARLGSGRLVASDVGLSIPTIYSVLTKHGVNRDRSRPRFDRRSERVTDAQIVETYGLLKSGNRTAKELGVTETTVYDALKRCGIKTRSPQERLRAFDPEREQELIDMYNDGLSIARIADETEVSAPTVWLYLRRAGVNTERRSRYSRKQKIDIREQYMEKVPLIKIAEQIGSTEQSVRRFLRKECADIWIEAADRNGERAPGWGGGRTLSHGYVYVLSDRSDPFHVMADRRGYVLEHRLVMARSLGRLLSKTETVHHINGDTTDNRIENLQLRQGKHGKHVVMMCLDCGSHNVGHALLAS